MVTSDCLIDNVPSIDLVMLLILAHVKLLLMLNVLASYQIQNQRA